MNCRDMQELLGKYWDLPENDLRRTAVSEHIRKCQLCANEYKIWQESAQWITHAGKELSDMPTSSSVKSAVMNRIYAEEQWRRPVTERRYSLTRRATMALRASVAACFMIFVFSFVFAIFEQPEEQSAYAFRPGVVPVMSAEQSGVYDPDILQHDAPTASVTAPFILELDTGQAQPNYLIVLSIIGVVFTLLIMSWLSRLRSNTASHTDEEN